jgi:LacI family transcriptional regulator
MTQKNITINDIARNLNVSPSTVSRALNNSSKISDRTKLLVHEKARELGYEINLIASSLSKENTGTIGLVIPSINRYFFSQAVSGIESVARENGVPFDHCANRREFR